MNTNSLRVPTLLLLLGFAALASCGNSGEFSSIAAGSEGGPCRSGNSCDSGLECQSSICSKPGAGGSAGSSGAAAGGGNTSTGGGSGGTDASGSGNVAGANGGATEISTGGAGGVDSGGEASGGAPVTCEGSHPLLADKTRYCDVGACYCNDPFDTCFPEATAKTCCMNEPLCGANQSDRGVNCAGVHPIIGPPRTCEPGNCFCSDGVGGKWDVCLPKDVASSCCPPGVKLTCVQ